MPFTLPSMWACGLVHLHWSGAKMSLIKGALLRRRVLFLISFPVFGHRRHTWHWSKSTEKHLGSFAKARRLGCDQLVAPAGCSKAKNCPLRSWCWATIAPKSSMNMASSHRFCRMAGSIFSKLNRVQGGLIMMNLGFFSANI